VKRTFYGQYTFFPWGYAVTVGGHSRGYAVTQLVDTLGGMQ